MYKILIFIFITIDLFAASDNLNIVMTDLTRYEETATSLSLRDTKISYDVPAVSYMSIRPNYLVYASLKMIQKQHIGTTYLGTIPIELKQEGWKYELGAGYKFSLTKNFFIAPALLLSDYHCTLYKTMGSNVVKTKSRDLDYRLYGLLGYEMTESTLMYISVELVNDIFSHRYEDDYSQYPVNATLYQFLSKRWFAYLKYQHTLRDKKASSDSTGNINRLGYGFGVGMKF